MNYDESNPFARILRGELPCIKVDETDASLAFMDVMPQSDGHVLVVPKEAAAEIFELSDAATVACMRMTQRIAIALRAALQPDGVFIGQFNGAAAGQTVAHVHFHVIPRWDGQPLRMHAREMAPQATLEAFAHVSARSLKGRQVNEACRMRARRRPPRRLARPAGRENRRSA
jgi:histidine triad (HIT) family protein